MLDTHQLVSLLLLVSLEIILGIDNILFLSLVTQRLPQAQQAIARQLGVFLAMLTRLMLLFSISWVTRLDELEFCVASLCFTPKDIVFLVGGLFLLTKSTIELHDSVSPRAKQKPQFVGASFLLVLVQIALIDIIFSLDSVILAIGLVDSLMIMVTAIVVAMLVMLLLADKISRYILQRPSLKNLTMAFLLLIGFNLIVEAFGFQIPKASIYFALSFALLVETINMHVRR